VTVCNSYTMPAVTLQAAAVGKRGRTLVLFRLGGPTTRWVGADRGHLVQKKRADIASATKKGIGLEVDPYPSNAPSVFRRPFAEGDTGAIHASIEEIVRTFVCVRVAHDETVELDPEVIHG
jgi:hypothetical protein